MAEVADGPQWKQPGAVARSFFPTDPPGYMNLRQSCKLEEADVASCMDQTMRACELYWSMEDAEI